MATRQDIRKHQARQAALANTDLKDALDISRKLDELVEQKGEKLLLLAEIDADYAKERRPLQNELDDILARTNQLKIILRRQLGDCYTLSEAASRLGVPYQAVFRMVDRGQLPGLTIGKHWYILKVAVDTEVEKNNFFDTQESQPVL